MKSEKVFVINKYGEKLVGLADFPVTQKDKFPAVILVHGFGGDKSEQGMFDDVSRGLIENNFLVYRFDFSGSGESEGDYSKTSLTKLNYDLRTIIDFVKSQRKVDSSKIGIVGMSFGTSVSVALNALEIKAYVFLGSVANPYEVLKTLFTQYTFNPNGMSFRITSEGKHIQLGSQFWRDLLRYDLVKTISEIKKPICFIHGEKDSAAPLSEAENFYGEAGGPKKLVVIKNADHGFCEPSERKEMVEEVVNWYKRFL